MNLKAINKIENLFFKGTRPKPKVHMEIMFDCNTCKIFIIYSSRSQISQGPWGQICVFEEQMLCYKLS